MTEDFLNRMAAGVPILDTVTRPCRVRKRKEKCFSIVLTQGLNRQIRRMCEALGYRVETDHRSEKIGFKIRQAQLEKVPYMLVVGDRDMEAGTVSVRTRTGEDLGAMTVADFTAMLHEVVDQKLKK